LHRIGDVLAWENVFNRAAPNLRQFVQEKPIDRRADPKGKNPRPVEAAAQFPQHLIFIAHGPVGQEDNHPPAFGVNGLLQSSLQGRKNFRSPAIFYLLNISILSIRFVLVFLRIGQRVRGKLLNPIIKGEDIEGILFIQTAQTTVNGIAGLNNTIAPH